MTLAPPLPVHVQRMESAFDLVVSRENDWDQHNWRRPSESEATCGTAYCFGGWTVYDAGFTPLFDLEAAAESSQDVLAYVVVPGDHPLAPDIKTAHHLDQDDLGRDVRRRVTDVLRDAPEGTRIVHIRDVAMGLLHAYAYRSDARRGGIHHAVFNGSNSLRTIRQFIDESRVTNSLEPRDFTTEPVQYRWDDTTPEAARKLIRERVDWFNENWAKTGQVVTLP